MFTRSAFVALFIVVLAWNTPAVAMGLKWLQVSGSTDLCLMTEPDMMNNKAATNAAIEQIAYGSLSDDFKVLINGVWYSGSDLNALESENRIALANNYASSLGIECKTLGHQVEHDSPNQSLAEEDYEELLNRIEQLEREIEQLQDQVESGFPPIYQGFGDLYPRAIDPNYTFGMACTIDNSRIPEYIYMLNCMRIDGY